MSPLSVFVERLNAAPEHVVSLWKLSETSA